MIMYRTRCLLPRSHARSGIHSIFRNASQQPAARIVKTEKPYRPRPKVSSIRVTASEPWSIPKKRLAALGCVCVFIISLYASYGYIRGPGPTASQVPADVSDRYDKIAKRFDKDVGFIEALYGYGWLRSWITREASGNVLEVSVGTGRNAQYYDLKKCTSITMIDQSGEMIEIAKEKFRSMSFIHQT